LITKKISYKNINKYIFIFFFIYILFKHPLKKQQINYDSLKYNTKISNKSIFFLKKNNLLKYNNYMYFQFLNLWYLKNIFNIKLKEKNINILKTIPKQILHFINYKIKKKNFKKFNIKYFNEVALLFISNIWVKNSKNICKFIKLKLNTVHFKKHKMYFLFFFRIFNKYILPNSYNLHIKGIYLLFKGKLGRGGNARKKIMSYKKGLYSLSSKNLGIIHHQWDVWTKTGSVGCHLRLFF